MNDTVKIVSTLRIRSVSALSGGGAKAEIASPDGLQFVRLDAGLPSPHVEGELSVVDEQITGAMLGRRVRVTVEVLPEEDEAPNPVFVRRRKVRVGHHSELRPVS